METLLPAVAVFNILRSFLCIGVKVQRIFEKLEAEAAKKAGSKKLSKLRAP